jgi:hypothetical protein
MEGMSKEKIEELIQMVSNYFHKATEFKKESMKIDDEIFSEELFSRISQLQKEANTLEYFILESIRIYRNEIRV